MKSTQPQRHLMSLFCVVLALLVSTTKLFALPNAEFTPDSPAWRLLPSQRELIQQRFEGYSGRPRYQMATHPDGSTSILVYYPFAGPTPILTRVAPNGTLLWSNPQPLTSPKSYGYKVRLAISGEQALLTWHEIQPRSVQARLFDAKGQELWTLEVTPLPWSEKTENQEHLTHLNAITWGQHGWAISMATTHRSYIYRLTAQGALDWKEGVALKRGLYTHGPISLIQDSPDSILVLWGSYHWPRGTETTVPGNIFAAQRLEPNGHFLWPQPITVGPSPALSMMLPREIELIALEQGRVKAKLYQGSASDINNNLVEYEAVIDPSGTVTPLPRKTP